jgi:hypothetical protein
MRALPILKAVAFAAVLFVLPGAATANPISSATLQTDLQSMAPPASEPAHCRRYLHRHRVCTRWGAGYCRVWRVRTHRC